jgi:hypothetical protein
VFGVTLGKLIALVIAIVALWRLIAFFQRMSGANLTQKRAPPPPGGARGERAQASVELVGCPHCGTYIPKGQPCPGPQRCIHKSAA